MVHYGRQELDADQKPRTSDGDGDDAGDVDGGTGDADDAGSLRSSTRRTTMVHLNNIWF